MYFKPYSAVLYININKIELFVLNLNNWYCKMGKIVL